MPFGTTVARKLSPMGTLGSLFAKKSGSAISDATGKAVDRVSSGLDSAGDAAKKGVQKTGKLFSAVGQGIKTASGKISNAAVSGFERTREAAGKVAESAAQKGRNIKAGFQEIQDIVKVDTQIQHRISRIKDEAEAMHEYILSVYTQDGKVKDTKRYVAATQLWQELVTLSLYPLMKQHASYGAQDDIAAYNIENARANRIVKDFVRKQREINREPKERSAARQFSIDEYMSKTPEDLQQIFRTRSGKLLKTISSKEGFTNGFETFANAPKRSRARKGSKARTSGRLHREIMSLQQ